jgi:steroid delta-isomerase-like uncharacterized protein
MSVSENIEMTKVWFEEVWNQGNFETIHKQFASDGVARGQSGPNDVIRGPHEFEAFVRHIRSAFSDINLKVADAFGAEDRVVVRWSGEMRHTGNNLGFPASNKIVRVGGISIVRFANGKMVEGWDHWDQLAMLEQVGAYRRPEMPLSVAS